MSINDRLASLEATVKAGFQTAARDRDEARFQAANDMQEMKDLYEKHSLETKNMFAAASLRLDTHDNLINQGKGFQKALTWVWGVMLAVWGIIEGLAHFGIGRAK